MENAEDNPIDKQTNNNDKMRNSYLITIFSEAIKRAFMADKQANNSRSLISREITERSRLINNGKTAVI